MNFLIEYYTPPTRAIQHVMAEGVMCEAQAREIFHEKTPLGIIRKVNQCDEDGKIIEPPTVDNL